MLLEDVLDTGALDAAITAGHVGRRRHPSLPLSIYTYTRAAQYDRAWTAVTTRCRGLIVDDTSGEVVAWPFPKFFNTGEHDAGLPYAPPLPVEPFEVFDKVDGSLGIVFHWGGRWWAASKGSFISEQARWAQQWLDTHPTMLLVPGVTYLAEILYPENRIVVDYQGRQDLVLLGAYAADGREIHLSYAAQDWQPVGSVVRSWPAMPLPDLLELTGVNVHPDGSPAGAASAEGYVIRFASGVRAKAKHAEYVRLHKLLTGISERDVWQAAGIQHLTDYHPPKQVAKAVGCAPRDVEAFAAGGRGPLSALLDQVPDEFDAWVRTVLAGIEAARAGLEQVIDTAYTRLAPLAEAARGKDRASRRAFAEAVQEIDSPTVRSAMFLRLDGRPTDLLVWAAVRPAASDPFKTDEEG